MPVMLRLSISIATCSFSYHGRQVFLLHQFIAVIDICSTVANDTQMKYGN